MKKSTRCLQGILCAALVCAMLQAAAPAMPAIAAEIEARFNSVRLELNGNTVAEEGESYTLPNGQSVPYSILYNDTTYLPIRKVCELLNIEVTWDQEGNTAGIVADVFGRRKTLIASQIASLISGTLMIFSTGFATTALALGCSALSYNLASGTREALAYDSLKQNGDEGFYARFSSTEMMLYRITNSTATLCAGLALWLGYRRAYAIDLFFGLIALGISFRLAEVKTDATPVHYPVGQEIVSVVQESWQFLVREKKARNIMLVNTLIGAVSTLVLFFLQAKLPLTGMNSALLGPALFVMGLGAALGSRMTAYFHKYRYRAILLFGTIGVLFAFLMSFTGLPALMVFGGFIGSFSDDFLEVRTDILLNDMIPSKQRATLMSVNSFVFSMIMIVLSTVFGWIM